MSVKTRLIWPMEFAATQTFVRLRKLKEFETQVGGFCLYSRDF
ncbi:hypothetical protein [Nostoc sp. CHAB 5836]|nr:hypothetical protein [Nostoc sp. CHAB 5836]